MYFLSLSSKEELGRCSKILMTGKGGVGEVSNEAVGITSKYAEGGGKLTGDDRGSRLSSN